MYSVAATLAGELQPSMRPGCTNSVVLGTCRALVDAPDATRKIMNFKRLYLTDQKVEIPRLASKKVLTAKLAESGEFNERKWALVEMLQMGEM